MAYTSSLVFFNATPLTQSSGPELASELVTVNNLDEADDDLGGVFAWNPSSEATDDATNVFRPASVSVSAPGRWIRVSGQPTATADFTVPITVTAASGNDTAITATGHGSGSGVQGTGGATGAGLRGIGGGNGVGTWGTGGATGGGGYFNAGGGNGYGVGADAAGSGNGGEFRAATTGAGVSGTGGSTSGAGGVFTASGGNSAGVTATGQGSGYGITATGGATDGVGAHLIGGGSNGGGATIESVGTGHAAYGYAAGSGSAIYGDASDGTGYAVVADADHSSPVKAALRIVPQDNVPSGASLVGDIYVTTAGVLKICTVAGTGGGATWVSVGAQS